MSIQQTENMPNPKEEIKKAIESGDMFGFLKAGFDNFMVMIFEHPLQFRTFLDYTGQFFDEYILETERTELLHFVGGKLVLEQLPAESIAMAANLYFQDAQKQWVMKGKTGQISKGRFSDWDKSLELQKLLQDGKLEFPIDPPQRA